jgi:hypothetical protein
MVPLDERDRYGEKLRQVEQARENQWAAERATVLEVKRSLTSPPPSKCC